MSVRLGVSRRVRPPRASLRVLARALDRAARRAGLGADDRAGLGVQIVGDGEMARLNRLHRGKRGPTDVLSFSYREDAFSGELVGDVVVDWDEVCRRELGRGRREHEAAQLGVHALAHLLGHDHDRARAARRMLRCERALARAARLPAPVRPYGGRR